MKLIVIYFCVQLIVHVADCGQKPMSTMKEIESIDLDRPIVYLVMGTSGSGKTTLGERLADHFHAPLIEADHFHTKEAKQKMASGISLTDDDRIPWLKLLAGETLKQVDQLNRTLMDIKRVIMTCSALKASYRKLIRDELKEKASLVVIYLHLPNVVALRQRVTQRGKHFFNADLIQSQLDTLEMPDEKIEQFKVIRLNVNESNEQQMKKEAIDAIQELENKRSKTTRFQ